MFFESKYRCWTITWIKLDSRFILLYFNFHRDIIKKLEPHRMRYLPNKQLLPEIKQSNSLSKLKNKIDRIQLGYNGEKIELTRREIEVLKLLLQGYTVKQSATFICRSPRTVENILAQIKAKFKCHYKSELVSILEKLNFYEKLQYL